MRRMILSAAMGVVLLGSGLAKAERQPNMVQAIEHLRVARADLERAEHNKGGHREEGLRLVDAAIKQCEDGIRYANEHPNEH
jgi:hypothetical protein